MKPLVPVPGACEYAFAPRDLGLELSDVELSPHRFSVFHWRLLARQAAFEHSGRGACRQPATKSDDAYSGALCVAVGMAVLAYEYYLIGGIPILARNVGAARARLSGFAGQIEPEFNKLYIKIVHPLAAFPKYGVFLAVIVLCQRRSKSRKVVLLSVGLIVLSERDVAKEVNGRAPGVQAEEPKEFRCAFVAILNSETLQDRLIGKFPVKKVYHHAKIEGARKDLAKHTEVSEDRKSGSILIGVTDHDPKRASAGAGENRSAGRDARNPSPEEESVAIRDFPRSHYALSRRRSARSGGRAG